MTRKEWIEKIEAGFFDIITSGKTLDDLTDCAYSFMGNPIMVTNERGEIFSKAKQNRPYGDAMWEEFDAKGYVPREKHSLISAVHFSEKMRNNTVIVFEPAHISHRLMLYQTTIGDTFILRTSMLESRRPFSEDDKIVFELFSKTAAYFLKNSNMVRNFNSNTFEFFLHELIGGRIDSEENADDITSYLSLQKGDRLVLLIAKRMFRDTALISLHEARMGLQPLFKNSIAFTYDERVVVFINLRELDGGLSQSVERASSFLRRSNMHACLSRSFGSFQNISEIYRATYEALEVGAFNNSAIYNVGDVLVTYLLDKLPKDRLECYCYLPVIELLELDKKEGSDYLLTMYAYTLTMGSVSAAARLLGVHYNTVQYRIQKIRQIVGEQLDELLPALYISVKALFLTRKDRVKDCFDLELAYRKTRRLQNGK